ncbi:hypothetical protein BD289DRAFT_440011 [Coniella lustricola]|uniref:Uncharacterized protein n=1 Tax=Coniella lustricola TaxID=2025994 RepID=A0A2T3A120_9PEZI|nr:hypothetical protein BD289DRAFT_440011 [Coniella lustricola]
MGEAWDDLAVLRAQRARCADDVSQLIASCAHDHPGNKHVLECRACYEKVVDRIRRRYLAPDENAPREWFAGRDALLKDLDELFSSVRTYKVGLEEVDARIASERQIWYQQQLTASPSIKKALEELLDKKDMYAKISARGAGFEETVSEVRHALRESGAVNGETSNNEASRTLDQLVGAKTTEERLQVYKQTFFQETADEPASGRMQKYLDRLQNGTTMNEIINKISMDRRSSIGAQGLKDQHKQRVEELRRAKNAHELQKSKKAGGRKDSNTKSQLPDEMYDQPPCHACSKEIDTQDFMACSLCQVMFDHGICTKPTVFCSLACFSGPSGQETHTEAAHDCASGDQCVQIHDEDTNMDMYDPGPYVCMECIGQFRRESVYCSAQCASQDFQRHREGIHIPERRRLGLDVNKDMDLLQFDDGSKSKYHARQIIGHLDSIGNLISTFQQENSIENAQMINP